MSAKEHAKDKMGRKYELKARAERQDETRQRIVAAAMALHTSVGPSRSSIKAVAERAGVQRHTVYRHFPDERSLFGACSAEYGERHPLPDPAAWRTIDDPAERLRFGLTAVYDYYTANAETLAPIVRDLEVHAPVREFFERGTLPLIERIRETLIEPFHARGGRRTRMAATLMLYLDFKTWRTLSRMLRPEEMVETAVRAVEAQ